MQAREGSGGYGGRGQGPVQGVDTRLRKEVRGSTGAAWQASVHRYRATAAACARARPAFRGPSPQTLRSVLTTTGGPPRVSWGVPRPSEARVRLGFHSTDPRTPPRPTPQPKGALRGTR